MTRPPHRLPLRCCSALCLVACFVLPAQVKSAGNVTQTFELAPGWNAVYLEVTPEDNAPQAVFANLPLKMAWAFFPASGPAEFIADPHEDLWNTPGWHVFIPEGREDSVLTNLHAVPGGRAYLLKIDADESVTWSVGGAPVHRSPDWEPNAYTLTGFPIDPEQTVNFGAYFGPSPAHRNQAYYRLTPEGEWTRAHNSAILERGEAYWVFTDRASNYQAPLEVELETGRSLDFGEQSAERLIHLENHTDWPMSVSLANDDGFPLLRGFGNESGETEWETFDQFSLELQAGERRTVRAGLRRSEINGDARGILVIAGGDSQHKIPMIAEEPASQAGAVPQAVPMQDGDENTLGGLWVGTVTVNAVSDVNDPEDASVPRPTPAEFSKRIIVHVKDADNARLLKQAILLWQDGDAGETVEDPAAPGRYVLVSDHDLIPYYKGATLRDGRPFGHRVSAASIDFEGSELPMKGTFGDELQAELTVSRDLPTNPFRHRFHPDHNHLDLDGNPLGEVSVGREEVWPVEREIALHFVGNATGSPQDGHSRLEGDYRETLTHLHSKPIHLEGEFHLRRVNPIRELNPEP